MPPFERKSVRDLVAEYAIAAGIDPDTILKSIDEVRREQASADPLVIEGEFVVVAEREIP